jgi:hypothetical protein
MAMSRGVSDLGGVKVTSIRKGDNRYINKTHTHTHTHTYTYIHMHTCIYIHTHTHTHAQTHTHTHTHTHNTLIVGGVKVSTIRKCGN